MKILVTGGAGFIASHVVDEYIKNGHDVVIVDNLSTGSTENINPLAKFYLMDIASRELEKVFEIEKPDIVNHHAAQISVPVSVKDPILDAQTNVLGLINLLQNCIKFNTGKIIVISSGGAVYGEADEYPTSENYQPEPLSPYAINKFVAEKYLFFYQHQYGLKYTVLRYANVFGPRQVPHGEAGVVSIFIENILMDKKSYLYAFAEEPDGMIRDYVFVRDVVKANLLALSTGDNDNFNIGTNRETSTGELFREISRQMNYFVAPIPGPARPGDIRKSCLTNQKAKLGLGWKPQYSLEKGIGETIDFFSTKFQKNFV
ncbi:MAG: GDP-mannose 4,6-dehydratase [Candidatus Cloacimonetes bacterium]|nr:GDP-mannose 4,6-dehydratase [Candidatus Cloacimonadota bacterium]